MEKGNVGYKGYTFQETLELFRQSPSHDYQKFLEGLEEKECLKNLSETTTENTQES